MKNSLYLHEFFSVINLKQHFYLEQMNMCCNAAHSLLSSRLLPKNANIEIYKTIISLVVLYGCRTWSLT
jgi:hypothetical protein